MKRPDTSQPPPGSLKGAKVEYSGTRLIYDRAGVRWNAVTDGYHLLMTMSWALLLALGALAYLIAIACFAVLYQLDPTGISGSDGSFSSSFFFSMQTLSTIGFGALAPSSTWAHFWTTVESFVGLVGVAMGTGIVFAKFSRPTARVMFSNTVVIHERNGVPTLMFRLANERQNQIVEAHMHATALMDEVTSEGHHMRRMRDLQLERSFSPLFAMSWTAIHPIDEDSPLYGLSAQELNDQVAVIVVTFSGIDDTFSQTVVARQVYQADAFHYDHRFVDMISRSESGRVRINHALIHDVEPLPTRL